MADLGTSTFMSAIVVDGAPLFLVTGEELARAMRFEGGVTSAFRDWCRKFGIKTVPGRNNVYDPKHVRERLDAAQGMSRPQAAADAPTKPSLVEQRRARRDGRH
ncbi:hypothetical protein [uncultured Amaricoccus sp.]|uniref:hypothetical protein n=1 Tax=uncultured Amaricoccus sp. TaxID=339341 RepID=UPI002621A2BA|nr:hypothetical protein [uncultured Amaricoccus sp.]HRO27396.1 hypothetical protein [Luteimonas sp.]